MVDSLSFFRLDADRVLIVIGLEPAGLQRIYLPKRLVDCPRSVFLLLSMAKPGPLLPYCPLK